MCRVLRMARLIMQRHKVVQARVHRARAQAQWQGQHQQPAEAGGTAVAQQRSRGHPHADGRDPPGAEPGQHAVRQQAGHHRTCGHDHGRQARIPVGHGQLLSHNRPGRAQHCIRQAQADKRRINERQKNGCHPSFLQSVSSYARLQGAVNRASHTEKPGRAPVGARPGRKELISGCRGRFPPDRQCGPWRICPRTGSPPGTAYSWAASPG